MARALTSAFIGVKNALTGAGPVVWLIELHRDSSNISRLTTDIEDVTFDSQTWSKQNSGVGVIEADNEGTLKDVKITVQNVDLAMSVYMEASKFRNMPMSISLVEKNNLSSAADKVVFRGIIKRADVNEEPPYVTFTCGTYDLRRETVPACKAYRCRCRWVFKSAACGYAGGETSCDKRYETCRDTMSNEDRYGGFPAIPLRHI